MSSDSPEPLVPLFLKLAGRDVLVVGGGAVAERKIADLVAARAAVRVVAIETTERVREMGDRGAITVALRAFEEADADGAWLVVAATNDLGVQERVRAAADARRLFCLAVDDVANATAYSAATIRRGPFTIAVSSSGATPALARLVREILEAALPEERWIEAAKALREKWKREGTPMAERFRELVDALRR
jgi:uroporphyrin-III C-methyltransferase/precorrin-2 dehydrogenase/sirohydrochlorin ferrochelatase